MGLLQKLKSAIGLDESRPGGRDQPTGDAGVTVEHDPTDVSEEPDTAQVGPSGVGSEREGAASEAGGPVEGATAVSEPTESEVTAEGDGQEGATAAEQVDTPEEPGGDGLAGDLTDISGIGPAYSDRLREAGIESPEALAGADADALSEATGIGAGRIENWIDAAGDR